MNLTRLASAAAEAGTPVRAALIGALEVGMRAVWVNAADADWAHELAPHGTIRERRELPQVVEDLNTRAHD